MMPAMSSGIIRIGHNPCSFYDGKTLDDFRVLVNITLLCGEGSVWHIAAVCSERNNIAFAFFSRLVAPGSNSTVNRPALPENAAAVEPKSML